MMKKLLGLFIFSVFIFSCSTGSDTAYVNINFGGGKSLARTPSMKRAVPAAVDSMEITVFVNKVVPVMNNVYTGDTESDTLALEPGSGYVFYAEAMDASGTVLYSGASSPVDLLAGEEKTVSITMAVPVDDSTATTVTVQLYDGIDSSPDATQDILSPLDMTSRSIDEIHLAMVTSDSALLQDLTSSELKKFTFKCQDLWDLEIDGSPQTTSSFDIALRASFEDFVLLIAWDATSPTSPIMSIGANQWTVKDSIDINIYSCVKDATTGELYKFCNCEP